MAGWKQAEPRDHELKGTTGGTIYDDPVLSSLVEQVNVSNQTLAQAEAQYRQARALVAQARAAYFPVVDASASASALARARQRTSRTGRAARSTATASRSTHRGSRICGAACAARSKRTSPARRRARPTSRAVRLSLQAELAQNYFLLRALDAQQQLFDDTVRAFEASLKLTQNRYNAGVVARADVVQAQTQLRTTQAQALDVGVQRAQLEHAIAVLIGNPPAEFSLPRSPLAAAPSPVIPVGLAFRAPRAPPRHRVGRAPRRVGQRADRRRASRVTFRRSRYRRPAVFRARAQPAADDAGALLVARRNARANDIRRGRAARANRAGDRGLRRDRRRYRQTVLTGFQEVEDNLAALRILEQEAQVQAEAVTAARQAVDITLNQYKAGTVSYINVLTAQTTALASERTAVDIQNRRLAASVLLIRALGGGWTAASLPGNGDLILKRSGNIDGSRLSTEVR